MENPYRAVRGKGINIGNFFQYNPKCPRFRADAPTLAPRNAQFNRTQRGRGAFRFPDAC